MNWEYHLGFRMLLGRKRRAFFSPMALIALCGIAFGMSATLVSLSVITGFQKAYEKAILGFNSHLVLVQEEEIEDPDVITSELNRFKVSKGEARYWEEHFFWWSWLGGFRFFSDAKMEELKEKGIQAYSPFVYREGLGLLPDEVTGIVLKGVDPKKVTEVYPIHYTSLGESETRLENLLRVAAKKLPPVLLGKSLFHRFFPEGISEEPVVRLLIPKGKWQEARRFKDLAQDFRVVGTFESGLHEFDSQFVLTSLSVMQELFDLGSQVSGIEMVLDDPSKANVVARHVESALPVPVQVISWDELNESLFKAMKMEKTLFVIIMLLIILIASFNVMGIIVMMIIRRRSDLAVLTSMGAPKGSLVRSLSLQGFLLGIIGTLVGTLLSALFLWSLERFKWFELDPQIYFITHLPVTWPKGLWLTLIAAALIICYGTSWLTTKVVLKHTSLIQSFR